MKPLLFLLPFFFAGLAALHAQTPDASGVLVDPAKVDPAGWKVENGAEASVEDEAGARVLKMSFPGGGGYPGMDFLAPDGTWDLSAFAGVEANVTNAGPGKVGVNLRVENHGDWRQSPWNANVVWLEPGATGTVTVLFGQSFGKPGFALNPSEIPKVKVFVAEPKGDGAILLHNVRGVGGDASPAAPSDKRR